MKMALIIALAIVAVVVVLKVVWWIVKKAIFAWILSILFAGGIAATAYMYLTGFFG